MHHYNRVSLWILTNILVDRDTRLLNFISLCLKSGFSLLFELAFPCPLSNVYLIICISFINLSFFIFYPYLLLHCLFPSDIRNYLHLENVETMIVKSAIKRTMIAWWWNTPLIPEFSRQRQGDLCKFEDNLVYMSFRTGRATQRNLVMKRIKIYINFNVYIKSEQWWARSQVGSQSGLQSETLCQKKQLVRGNVNDSLFRK